MFNNILFYKSKVIPAWLAIFGLIGAALVTLQTVLFLVIDIPSLIGQVAWVPIMLFEFILGFYLIFRGMKKETP